MTKEGFERIYEDNFENVYRYAYRRVNDVAIAEDIASQAFFKALKAYPSFDPAKAKASTWLFAIASNVLIDFYRSHREYDDVEAYAETVGACDDTAERMDADARMERAYAQLGKLPAKTREIIMLRIFEELSFVEISKIVGIGESGVKMSFARGIETLKNSMVQLVFILLISLFR